MGGGAGAGLLEGRLEDGESSTQPSRRALTWGKKNAVLLSLDKFTAVYKGKTTERTIRNSSPSSRLLSIMTRGNESLDIEAPTMLDRDKFAVAFARFLNVPCLEEEDVLAQGVGGVQGGRGRRSGVGSGEFANVGDVCCQGSICCVFYAFVLICLLLSMLPYLS